LRKWIVFIGLFLAGAVQAQPLKLLTEEYPPFSYREAGIYKGASIDQVNILMKNAGLEYSIEMLPWARALMLAETQEATCVFITVHNEERDKRFKWVEPLLVDHSVLIRKTGSGVNPATLAEATKFVVGAQRGDFAVDVLKADNFTRIDLATDLNLTLKKLLNGRIDLMPISERYFDKLKRDDVHVDKVLVLSKQIYSMACNRSVPDADIARMQAGLKTLIDNGTQDVLLRKYGLDK
jgi:polar amino acid transport system substrate-binding protein